MKNIILLFLLSILFLGCSGNTEPVDTSKTFLEKYQNTFWKNQNTDPIGYDYWGFKNEDIFLHTVFIEKANNNQMTCFKINKGVNSLNGTSFNVNITKNTSTELWVDIDAGVNDKESLRFSINSSGTQMTLIQFVNGQLEFQENYSLTNLTYDFFCSSSTATVPAAPTGLTGSLTSSTQATLNWTDNSMNETGFKIERKSGTGNFTQIATVGTNVTNYVDNGFSAISSYTYRVVSYNAAGNSLSYTNELSLNSIGSSSVTDIDGNVYSTVQICNQIWMQKNLTVSHYRNGDVIPQVTDPAQWANLTTGAWCYYQNNTANGTIYGKLYNWYAINDPRGLAPQGWHIPSDAEWTTLTTCLGGAPVAGGKMKETGYSHWQSPNTEATNSSGFSALPAGLRENNGTTVSLGYSGIWWSSSEYSSTTAWGRGLNYNSYNISREDEDKDEGYSVRCVKN